MIIAIGDELLMGQVTDTNSGWLAKELDNLGIETIERLVLPDQVCAIKEGLDLALREAQIVVLTGGLGPTKDDVTKQTLANYFGQELLLNQEVLQHIEHLFAISGRQMREEHLQQAFIPSQCIVLPNSLGTAPGMWFQQEDQIVISLPGVPYEMKDIILKETLPRLQKAQLGFYRGHRYFFLIGLPETDAARLLEELEQSLPSPIKLAYLPGEGFLRLRLSGTGQDQNLLHQQLNQLATTITTRLQPYLISQKNLSLEQIIAEELLEQGLSIGTAESCTGGLIAHKLTNVPGSSQYFKGSILSYANDVKERLLNVKSELLQTEGAVSEAAVLTMATNARQLLKVDVAIATSGIMGPTGATAGKPIGTVWIALATAQKVMARCFHFRYDRRGNKERTANVALGWAIQTLQAVE